MLIVFVLNIRKGVDLSTPYQFINSFFVIILARYPLLFNKITPGDKSPGATIILFNTNL